MGSADSEILVRDGVVEDLPVLADIYNHYVGHSSAALYTEPLSVAAMQTRFEAAKAENYAFLVAERAGKVVGFAYCNDFRPHGVYQLPECSVFLAQGVTRQGIGRKLFGALIEQMRKTGVAGLVSVIVGGNPGSNVLHQISGFHLAGVLTKVGTKMGRFVDIELWQLHF